MSLLLVTGDLTGTKKWDYNKSFWGLWRKVLSPQKPALQIGERPEIDPGVGGSHCSFHFHEPSSCTSPQTWWLLKVPQGGRAVGQVSPSALPTCKHTLAQELRVQTSPEETGLKQEIRINSITCFTQSQGPGLDQSTLCFLWVFPAT